ncbi:MAG: hypothetical protein A2066_12560 [Bacteroidetes bacterium GWB2_41_8]|nr:MAG: hypothetical protein A2066_12560 [Bacteroidetes bacterium GWB2_41_8]
MNLNSKKYSIKLSFEEIRLPPFEDALILGKKCPQGKIGVSRSFELLIPNEFEMYEIKDDIVEAVFINKRILKKINKDRIIGILKENVFPYVSESEIIKVNIDLMAIYNSIEIDSDDAT